MEEVVEEEENLRVGEVAPAEEEEYLRVIGAAQVDVEEVIFTFPPINSEPSPSTCTFKPVASSEIKWHRGRHNITEPACLWNDATVPGLHDMDHARTPFEIFEEYIPFSIYEAMAVNTNLYAVQTNAKNYKMTNTNEMKQLVALHILSGILKYPRIEMYWDSSLQLHFF